MAEKRESSDHESDNEIKSEGKTKKAKMAFEEPESGDQLKHQLHDKDTSEKALKWLSNLKESPLARQIIHQYCQLTKDYQGIVRLLATTETPKRKMLACAAIEAVVLVLTGDEESKDVLSKFGLVVCSKDNLRSIASILAAPNGYKPVLKLLTALVVSSAQMAGLVVSNFNWDMFKKNISDAVGKYSVARSCLAYLALSIVFHAEEQNETVITSALTGKCRYLFDILFTHLHTIVEEDADLVVLIMDTLLKKVVENPRINKTTKMKLFNEENMEKIIRLLNLPAASHMNELTLQLIKRLFTDTKLGVVFFDSKFGTSIIKDGANITVGNSNLLATKIISFLLAQQNSDCLSLLVDILSTLPDQIPHYFEQLKAQVKQTDILLANSAVVAQLPPVASYVPSKNVASDEILLSLLTQLSLPQSNVFLDQARISCKVHPNIHWEMIPAPVSFLAAVTQRCVGVFTSKRALVNRDNVLRLFFWRVKRSLVDPDKVFNVAMAGAELLKTNKPNSDVELRNVVGALNSCLLYLVAYFRFSGLLVLSFPLEKLIFNVQELCQVKQFRKLRKPLARLCLTVGLAKDWAKSRSITDDSLLRWVIDEAVAAPGQYAMVLSQIFLQLSGNTTLSEGDLALIIALLAAQAGSSGSDVVIKVFELICLSAKKSKKNSIVNFLENLELSDEISYGDCLESLKILFMQKPYSQQCVARSDSLSKFFALIHGLEFNNEQLSKSMDDLFLMAPGSPTLNDIFASCLIRWLVQQAVESQKNNQFVGPCLANLFKYQRNIGAFLRSLASINDGEMISIKHLSESKELRSCLGSSLAAVCAFIRNNPSHVAVCLVKHTSLQVDDSLCRFDPHNAAMFVKSLLKKNSDASNVSPSVGLVISLCKEADDITSIAKIVAKHGRKQDFSTCVKILAVLLAELNCRNGTVDRVFSDYGAKLVFDENSNSNFEIGADLLYDVIASQPRSCTLKLRSLICSAPVKVLKSLLSYWTREHDGKVTFPCVCAFLAECLVTVSAYQLDKNSPKTRQRLFEIISNILPAIRDSATSEKLFQCGVRCLIQSDSVNPESLLSFISHCDVSVCRQKHLLTLLNFIASSSSTDKIEADVAIKGISSLLKALVNVPLDEYHQGFTSSLSSLLTWSGVSSATLTCVSEACSTVNLGAIKTRHKTKLVAWLLECCSSFQGAEKWMVHAYVTPAVIQCAFSAPDELINDDVRSLVDSTESLLFDQDGNPHDFLIKTLNSDKEQDLNNAGHINLIIRCLHALLWYRGPQWRSYNSIWRSIVPVLLSNYTGTLSERDQLILSSLATFDNCFDSHDPERALWPPYQPCIWGPKANAKKPISFASTAPGFSPSFTRQNADIVLECVSSGMLLSSALQMPIERSLFEIERGILIKSQEEIYDPAFLVPVFARTLATQNWPLSISKFVYSNVLSYLLAALSLKDDRLRAMAYSALVGFETYARKQPKPSQPLLQFFDIIRKSIPEVNCRIAPVMGSFLARLPGVLFGSKTSSSMTKPLNAILRDDSPLELAHILHPTVPASIANAFYYPADLENAKAQRSFLLDVASSGVRDIDSISSSRDGFNMLPLLAALLNSPLCSSASEYLLILKLFADFSNSSEAAVNRLVKVHRLHLLAPTFLSNKYVLNSGSRMVIEKNNAVASGYVNSLRQSFAKNGLIGVFNRS